MRRAGSPPLVLLLLLLAAAAFAQKTPNYEDDVKPVFRRRCFACHNATEMRSGLNLESYAGVMKGGGAGEAVKPGRPTQSLLYLAVAHEGDGVPRMPLGGERIPGAEIALIREWIERGALANATSKPKGPAAPSLSFQPAGLNRPQGPAAMPGTLAALDLPRPARSNPVTALAASPWAPLAAVAGHDRIDLYDLEKRAPLGSLAFPEGIPYVLRFSRDGSLLLAGGGRGVETGKVALFDVRSGRRLATLGEEMDVVLAADVSADGKLVALGGPGKVVKVFSVADGKLLYTLTRHTDWITALQFSPDGARLATGDRSGGIHLWESARGGILVSLSEHKDAVTALTWRGDGRLLASAGEDGQIVIWDAVDGFPAATIAKAHTPKAAPNQYGKIPGGVLGLEYLPDGRLASVGRDRVIRLWTGDSGKPAGASQTADSLLTRVAAAWDGKQVLAGDFQGRVVVWDGKGGWTQLAGEAPRAAN